MTEEALFEMEPSVRLEPDDFVLIQTIFGDEKATVIEVENDAVMLSTESGDVVTMSIGYVKLFCRDCESRLAFAGSGCCHVCADG